MRKSLILYGAERFAAKIQALFAGSLIANWLSDVAPRAERSFRQGRLGKVSDMEYDRRAWQYRLRRAMMCAEERSLLLRLRSRFAKAFLQTSVGSYGLFGVLYGVFSCAVWLASPSEVRNTLSLIAALIFTVVCVPLLRSAKSMSYAICNSRVLHWLLFDVCGLSEAELGSAERGNERYWMALFFAFLFGGGSLFLSVERFLILLLMLLAGSLFFAVPELLTVLLLFALPFLNCFSHPTQVLTVCALLIELAWIRKALVGRREWRIGVLDLLVVLFAFAVLCGGMVGAGGNRSVFAGGVMCVLILFWFPMRNLFCRSVWRARAACALRLSCLITAVWGIGQYFFTDLELRWVDLSRFSDIGGRVCGPFHNPNIFAVFLLSVMPLFLTGAMDGDAPFMKRCLHFAGFAACGLCLILTWSRGAWLGILAAVLLFFLCYSPRSMGYLLLFLLPLGCALPFLPQNVVNRFSSIGSFSESSIRYRFYTWQGVLRMLKDHPWGIGAGSEAFAAVYPSYAVSGTESVAHTHHLLLQIMTEFGVHGLAVFLAFLLFCVFAFAHSLKGMRGKERGMMLGAFCGIIAVLVMGLFDDVWYHYGMLFLFFVLAAWIPADTEEVFYA